MLTVVADDLTGAAELAGIGITYGLTVELAMSVNRHSKADLLVISTDARSVSEAEAVQEMMQVSQELKTLKPDLIYKKIDSVLRGHVIAETMAQMRIFNRSSALLVSANPALGRTLVGGHYYVHGEPIHQTYFAQDPEFPIRHSDVLKRFEATATDLVVKTYADSLPGRGMVLGEVETQADLQQWASRISSQLFPGGGSGFFTAILESMHLTRQVATLPPLLGSHQLYVCGTSFGDSVALVRKAVKAGYSVHYMPKALTTSANESECISWSTAITTSIREHQQVIMAIDPETVEQGNAIHLRTIMAKVVKLVFDQIPVDELIIEGGSTASAVLREMGVNRLFPTQELAAGVVRSAVVGNGHLYITVKPGSYRWPTDLWKF